MKVVYVAHPISGDVKGNLEKIRLIIRELNINNPDIIPFAPYWVDCHALDDSIPEERERGIKNNTELIKKCVDEIWFYGDKMSKGMWAEYFLAIENKIPTKEMTPETMLAVYQLYSPA